MDVRNQGSDSMRMWGCLLRCMREAVGMTQEQLAKHVGYSVALVVSVERGLRMPSHVFVQGADEAVKANGWLKRAGRFLSRERVTIGSDEHLDEERRARSCWAYSTHVLHPLLRTEAYTRALLLAHRPVLLETEIETRTLAEGERQALLRDHPECSYSFIIEEWILHRRTGGPDAVAQIRHLITVAELRNVTLQIMPMTHEAHPGLGGPVTLFESPEHRWLAHIDVQNAQHLIDDAGHVSDLHDCYTHLRSLALPPADSTTLLQRIADRIEHGDPSCALAD